jgi:hypothetical protein
LIPYVAFVQFDPIAPLFLLAGRWYPLPNLQQPRKALFSEPKLAWIPYRQILDEAPVYLVTPGSFLGLLREQVKFQTGLLAQLEVVSFRRTIDSDYSPMRKEPLQVVWQW